jgi:crossover junction endodeoxyribonuclease RuvC
MPNSPKILKPKRILGIDPGYERLGIAVLENEKLIHSECFKTAKTDAFTDRLKKIGNKISEIIEKFEPDALAIENLFVDNNQKTAMRVGEVRGVIIYLAAARALSIHEYTPLQVKIAVTGYGKSDKMQVESMTRRLLKIDKKVSHDDEMDAIAIALTGSVSVH